MQWYILEPAAPSASTGHIGGGGQAARNEALQEGNDDAAKLFVGVDVLTTALLECSKCRTRLQSGARPGDDTSGRIICPKCTTPFVLPPVPPPTTHMFPPSDPWDILVLIVGVRDLKSPSLLPLFKPHVTVACLNQ